MIGIEGEFITPRRVPDGDSFRLPWRAAAQGYHLDVDRRRVTLEGVKHGDKPLRTGRGGVRPAAEGEAVAFGERVVHGDFLRKVVRACLRSSQAGGACGPDHDAGAPACPGVSRPQDLEWHG